MDMPGVQKAGVQSCVALPARLAAAGLVCRQLLNVRLRGISATSVLAGSGVRPSGR
jgi:hypothetical protein